MRSAYIAIASILARDMRHGSLQTDIYDLCPLAHADHTYSALLQNPSRPRHPVRLRCKIGGMFYKWETICTMRSVLIRSTNPITVPLFAGSERPDGAESAWRSCSCTGASAPYLGCTISARTICDKEYPARRLGY
ncbi:hypothetical protein DL89DRAFT_68957 [Linderina pennispora]|uniref:Uncharacterized protein n=1 Tax=Linderina pennispora TaxID=61395 RepID=A0A1Y1VYF7_9FUNG|nr:uncharacterized protein DL89DRAFT_68957 [Linderina pennispora]ORX66298.1 hypothetical protein DL89DRAFT_68957 [Linderina pennispora]